MISSGIKYFLLTQLILEGGPKETLKEKLSETLGSASLDESMESDIVESTVGSATKK